MIISLYILINVISKKEIKECSAFYKRCCALRANKEQCTKGENGNVLWNTY